MKKLIPLLGLLTLTACSQAFSSTTVMGIWTGSLYPTDTGVTMSVLLRLSQTGNGDVTGIYSDGSAMYPLTGKVRTGELIVKTTAQTTLVLSGTFTNTTYQGSYKTEETGGTFTFLRQ